MPNTTQRTFASGVTFQLGMLSATFDVAPVKAPRSKRVTVCSDCEELTKLSQVMQCPNVEEHKFDLASAARAMEIDGELQPLSEDDLLDLKEDEIETGVLNLSVCPTSELDEATRASDSGYRVRLNKKARGSEQYALFMALASDPDLCLYGVAKLNGRVSPTPFRLGVWQGQLVLIGVTRPDALAQVDAIECECSEELVAMGRQYMQSVSAPFDEELLVDSRKAKLEAIIATKQPAVAKAKTKASKAEPSLLAILTAAMEKKTRAA